MALLIDATTAIRVRVLLGLVLFLLSERRWKRSRNAINANSRFISTFTSLKILISCCNLMILTNFVLWSCLVGALTVLADRNITVDDFDPRIVYAGEWKHENVSTPLPCPHSADLCGVRVVRHLIDSIVPRVILSKQRRPHHSGSTAQLFTSYPMGSHHPKRTPTR